MITYSMLILTLEGLACAAALAAAARALAVKEDPRVERALEILPGANCGGCGYAGCADFAEAVVASRAPVDGCTAGGAETADALADLLGRERKTAVRKVAVVLCGGDTEKSIRRSPYNGVADCRAAAIVAGGGTACAYGCLGYGTCARACMYGAIEITSGRLAVVHPELCTGCGACARVCPRNLIALVPADRDIHVLCSSKDRGALVRRICKVGCIGCGACVKHVGSDSISVEDSLAVIDYTRPSVPRSVMELCPSGCIVERPAAALQSKGKPAAEKKERAVTVPL